MTAAEPPSAVTPPAATPAAEIAGPEALERAATLLHDGRLVAFPTETVYGLGANAMSIEALDRLYRVKGRPRGHPVIVHLRSAADLDQWAIDIPAEARRLAQAFWPGAVTLVLRRAAHVPDAVTGGADTIALRVPSHPIAQGLLSAFATLVPEGEPVGIAAPSANRYGKVSPTTAQHVAADLQADVDLILDGGACELGIESAIVDLSGEQPAMLRPGRIPASDIERVIQGPLAAPGADSPKAPGTHAVHYAPRAKVQLVNRRQIIETLSTNRGRRVAVLALEVSVPRLAAALTAVVPAVAAQYARSLYANLRTLDAAGADVILVEMPPDTPAWTGVMDRLRRAAAR